MGVFATRQPPRGDPPAPLPPRAPEPPPRRATPPPRRHRGTRGAANVQVVVLLVVAATLLGLVAAGVTWYRVAHTLQTARPVKVPTIRPVSGVVWGGRVFSSRQALTAWLNARGATYARWSARNPDLARILETK